MAGPGAAGDKQRRVCTQGTLESFKGFQGNTQGGKATGLGVTSGLFT